MKLLVTGIAGFIGSHLAERLLARGDALVGLDCYEETLYPAALHEQNLAVVRAAASSRGGALDFVHGDLADEATVNALFEQHRFDAVVHLGGIAGVRPSLAHPLRYERSNVRGTLVVLEAMRRAGVRRLVFASSSSVYGSRSEVPFREIDPAVHPASPYAATKRAGELLCDNYAGLYGLNVASLRFFTVYGPRQRPEMAIHKFARHILAGEPLPFYGDGSTARDYTFIDDIIDGVVAALDSTAADGSTSGHRIYNLGGSRTTSLSQLVTLLERAIGKPAQLDRQPDQPGDVPITCADVTEAERAFGYRPKVAIEDGMTRFVDWLNKRGA